MVNEESSYRALTLRLTTERHEAATRLARQLGMSLNQLMQQALDELLAMDRDLALFRAAALLGEPCAGNDGGSAEGKNEARGTSDD